MESYAIPHILIPPAFLTASLKKLHNDIGSNGDSENIKAAIPLQIMTAHQELLCHSPLQKATRFQDSFTLEFGIVKLRLI